MTTFTPSSEASAGYCLDEAAVVADWLRIVSGSEIAQLETASVRIRPIRPSATRSTDQPRRISLRRSVLRRFRGFVIEMGREEAKVGFVEGGSTHEYYLPASHLGKAGITAENQPFQMDEVEIETESGVIVGYEFRPLAKPSDAFRDSFRLDAERERKRDLIFKMFRNVED
jgi:hypothetical protein